MLYDTVLSEELVRMFTPNWAFGDIFLTEGAQEMIEAGVDVDSLFQRVMNGDYGLISADASDHQMTVKEPLNKSPVF